MLKLSLLMKKFTDLFNFYTSSIAITVRKIVDFH